MVPIQWVDKMNKKMHLILLASILLLGTIIGNTLIILAVLSNNRLQNGTNFFLMSLAISDLMVAILVMPFGILSLVAGNNKLQLDFTYVI